MASLYHTALEDLGRVFSRIDETQVEAAVDEIAAARRIALYGCGREGLAIKGLAMRLYHLGLKVAVVGDMTAHPIGAGDLLIVSGGPGAFSTVRALMDVARSAGARTLIFTAQPTDAGVQAADVAVTLPAQTAADDASAEGSVLPMGSLFEGAEFILFEVLIIKLRARLGVAQEAMWANHTNLE